MKFRFLFLFLFAWVTRAPAQGQGMTLFAPYAGEWKVKVSMWASAADAPMVHEVKAHSEQIMNALFLVIKFQGSMMGMNFSAINTIGYDQSKQKFEATWIDNMNPNIVYTEGTADSNSRHIELKGITFDPISKQDVPYNITYSLTDSRNLKIEVYSVLEGKEMKTWEYDLSKLK